jgi:ribosomal protein S18 acetylase RimI-like enzyme
VTITIRMLGRDDAQVLDSVAADVFDNAIDAARTREFLDDVRHHMAVALDGTLVIGMASAVHYVHPDKGPELWINEVGVAPAYRGRRIAGRLIEALFERGREVGCTEAWLGTEPENEAARKAYRTVGGKEQGMVYITFEL